MRWDKVVGDTMRSMEDILEGNNRKPIKEAAAEETVGSVKARRERFGTSPTVKVDTQGRQRGAYQYGVTTSI